jgi:hypothetical protein
VGHVYCCGTVVDSCGVSVQCWHLVGGVRQLAEVQLMAGYFRQCLQLFSGVVGLVFGATVGCFPIGLGRHVSVGVGPFSGGVGVVVGFCGGLGVLFGVHAMQW